MARESDCVAASPLSPLSSMDGVSDRYLAPMRDGAVASDPLSG